MSSLFKIKAKDYSMHTLREFKINLVPKVGPVVKPPFEPTHFDIEIGAGVGLFALNYSLKNPDRYLVAIEKTKNKFSKFKRRFDNHTRINLIPIHANAIFWISHQVTAKSVDRYFILYPNPCPKDPQKRFFRTPFMSWLIETLKPGGQIILASNEEFYIDEARKQGKSWGLKLINDEIYTGPPRTHFEKKYLMRGEICWNLVFCKK